MYIFIKYKRFGQTKRDNLVFWVEIARFIIDINGKRILIQTYFPSLKQKFLFGVLCICYLALLYQRLFV